MQKEYLQRMLEDAERRLSDARAAGLDYQEYEDLWDQVEELREKMSEA